MSAQHTPGPWKLNHRGDEVMGASGTTVGLTLAKVTQFVPEFRAGSDANARLMATAPELLQALQRVLEDEEVALSRPDFEFARAAIAKATGGEA